MSTMKKMSGIAATAMLCLVMARPGAAAMAETRDDQKRTEPTVAGGTPWADAQPAFDGLPAADLMSHLGLTFETGSGPLAAAPVARPCVDIPGGTTLCCIKIIVPFCWIE